MDIFKKSELKILKKLFLCFVPIIIVILFSFVATTFFQEYFITDGYLSKYQENYAKNDQSYNRVLIIGDSHAQSAYMPSILSPDTYNFAIGSENPVDGYYRLVEYLKNHEKPRYIFCAFNEKAFYDQNDIWNGPIKLHTLPLDIAFAIMQDAENYSNATNLKKDYYAAKLLMYHYGVNGDSVYLSLKGLIRNLLGRSCYDAYLAACKRYKETNGQGIITSDIGGNIVEGRPTAADGVSFPITDMADAYLKRIIELCEEKSIRFIYETIPFNRSSYEATSEQYMKSYSDYWAGIVSEYPDVIVNSEISCYDNQYFSDGHHLNVNGSEKFSRYIREKYSYIFDGGQPDQRA